MKGEIKDVRLNLGLFTKVRKIVLFFLFGLLVNRLFADNYGGISDSAIRNRIVGEWVDTNSSSHLKIESDGSFKSEGKIKTNNMVFYGLWKIQDGVLIMTQTNVDGALPHVPTRYANHLKITKINDRELICQTDDLLKHIDNNKTNYTHVIQTISLLRTK